MERMMKRFEIYFLTRCAVMAHNLFDNITKNWTRKKQFLQLLIKTITKKEKTPHNSHA